MKNILSNIIEVIIYIFLIIGFLGILGLVVIFPILLIILSFFMCYTDSGISSILTAVTLLIFSVGEMYYFIVRQKVFRFLIDKFKSAREDAKRVISSITNVKKGPPLYIRVPFEMFNQIYSQDIKDDKHITELINQYNINKDIQIKKQILFNIRGVMVVYYNEKNRNLDSDEYCLSINAERGCIDMHLVQKIEIEGKWYIPLYTNVSTVASTTKGYFCEFNFNKLTRIMFLEFGGCEYQFINGKPRDKLVDGIIINPETDKFVIETSFIKPLIKDKLVLDCLANWYE